MEFVMEFLAKYWWVLVTIVLIVLLFYPKEK